MNLPVRKSEGNAAFDASEYIDTLIAAGYEPSVVRRPDGSMAYLEMRPRGLTETQRAACHAVWAKCEMAPDGIEMVKVECVRRGLIERA